MVMVAASCLPSMLPRGSEILQRASDTEFLIAPRTVKLHPTGVLQPGRASASAAFILQTRDGTGTVELEAAQCARGREARYIVHRVPSARDSTYMRWRINPAGWSFPEKAMSYRIPIRDVHRQHATHAHQTSTYYVVIHLTLRVHTGASGAQLRRRGHRGTGTVRLCAMRLPGSGSCCNFYSSWSLGPHKVVNVSLLRVPRWKGSWRGQLNARRRV